MTREQFLSLLREESESNPGRYLLDLIHDNRTNPRTGKKYSDRRHVNTETGKVVYVDPTDVSGSKSGDDGGDSGGDRRRTDPPDSGPGIDPGQLDSVDAYQDQAALQQMLNDFQEAINDSSNDPPQSVLPSEEEQEEVRSKYNLLSKAKDMISTYKPKVGDRVSQLGAIRAAVGGALVGFQFFWIDSMLNHAKAAYTTLTRPIRGIVDKVGRAMNGEGIWKPGDTEKLIRGTTDFALLPAQVVVDFAVPGTPVLWEWMKKSKYLKYLLPMAATEPVDDKATRALDWLSSQISRVGDRVLHTREELDERKDQSLMSRLRISERDARAIRLAMDNGLSLDVEMTEDECEALNAINQVILMDLDLAETAAERMGSMTSDMLSLFRLGAQHAPKGGVTIGGVEYEGGEFIPGDVVEQAVEEGGEAAQKLDKKTPKQRDKKLLEKLPEHSERAEERHDLMNKLTDFMKYSSQTSALRDAEGMITYGDVTTVDQAVAHERKQLESWGKELSHLMRRVTRQFISAVFREDPEASRLVDFSPIRYRLSDTLEDLSAILARHETKPEYWQDLIDAKARAEEKIASGNFDDVEFEEWDEDEYGDIETKIYYDEAAFVKEKYGMDGDDNVWDEYARQEMIDEINDNYVRYVIEEMDDVRGRVSEMSEAINDADSVVEDLQEFYDNPDEDYDSFIKATHEDGKFSSDIGTSYSVDSDGVIKLTRTPEAQAIIDQGLASIDDDEANSPAYESPFWYWPEDLANDLTNYFAPEGVIIEVVDNDTFRIVDDSDTYVEERISEINDDNERDNVPIRYYLEDGEVYWKPEKETSKPEALSLIRLGGQHAPAGGVNIKGNFYKGGQFIPGEIVDELSEGEKQEKGLESDSIKSSKKMVEKKVADKTIETAEEGAEYFADSSVGRDRLEEILGESIFIDDFMEALETGGSAQDVVDDLLGNVIRSAEQTVRQDTREVFSAAAKMESRDAMRMLDLEDLAQQRVEVLDNIQDITYDNWDDALDVEAIEKKMKDIQELDPENWKDSDAYRSLIDEITETYSEHADNILQDISTTVEEFYKTLKEKGEAVDDAVRQKEEMDSGGLYEQLELYDEADSNWDTLANDMDDVPYTVKWNGESESWDVKMRDDLVVMDRKTWQEMFDEDAGDPTDAWEDQEDFSTELYQPMQNEDGSWTLADNRADIKKLQDSGTTELAVVLGVDPDQFVEEVNETIGNDLHVSLKLDLQGDRIRIVPNPDFDPDHEDADDEYNLEDFASMVNDYVEDLPSVLDRNLEIYPSKDGVVIGVSDYVMGDLEGPPEDGVMDAFADTMNDLVIDSNIPSRFRYEPTEDGRGVQLVEDEEVARVYSSDFESEIEDMTEDEFAEALWEAFENSEYYIEYMDGVLIKDGKVVAKYEKTAEDIVNEANSELPEDSIWKYETSVGKRGRSVDIVLNRDSEVRLSQSREEEKGLGRWAKIHRQARLRSLLSPSRSHTTREMKGSNPDFSKRSRMGPQKKGSRGREKYLKSLLGI